MEISRRRADLKTVVEIKKLLESQRDDLRAKYGVREIGIFGSYVREEHKDTSDVDILVDFERPVGLLLFTGLKNHLSDVLGAEVDLVMKKALKPRIGKRILEEVVYV